MTHLPYIAGAYGLTLALAAWLSLAAMLRLARARTRLRAVEQQAGRVRRAARSGP
nr:hypothetical protein [uncultured Lichenicoccus sp.]